MRLSCRVILHAAAPNDRVEPPSPPAVSSHSTGILDRGCPGLSLKELSTSAALTHPISCLSSTVFADCLPRPTLPPFSGHAAFTALVVLLSRPTTPRTPLPTSLTLIGSLPSVARGSQESSWGHAQIFRTVPSANTLVRWVNENAFAPVMRARPCPAFGRPVRPWSSLLDYGPVLLRIPFGSRLAAGTLSSEARRAVASGPSCLYPAFAFVP